MQRLRTYQCPPASRYIQYRHSAGSPWKPSSPSVAEESFTNLLAPRYKISPVTKSEQNRPPRSDAAAILRPSGNDRFLGPFAVTCLESGCRSLGGMIFISSNLL